MAQDDEAIIEEPDWSRAVQHKKTLIKTSKSRELALGAIAKSAVSFFKISMGDLPGLAGLLGTLKNEVLTLGFSSGETSSHTTNCMYNEAKGQYASYIIKDISGSKTLQGGPLKARDAEWKVSITCKVLEAKNEAAKNICKKLVAKAAGNFIKDENEVFEKEVFKNKAFKKKDHDKKPRNNTHHPPCTSAACWGYISRCCCPDCEAGSGSDADTDSDAEAEAEA